MRNKHLDEIEIQQYLFEEHNFPPDIDEHIKHCKECRIRAEQYRLIFELVRDQKKPVFDFMLDKLVMKLVNENKTEYSFGKILIYYIVLIAVPVTAAAIYLFRTTLSDLLTGLAPILIYLIINVF